MTTDEVRTTRKTVMTDGVIDWSWNTRNVYSQDDYRCDNKGSPPPTKKKKKMQSLRVLLSKMIPLIAPPSPVGSRAASFYLWRGKAC